ncbi:MAG: YhcH/YjgK/YiaL family protein [Christensenellales bacterium]
MILDKLQNLPLYRGISPDLDTAILGLQGMDLQALPEGRHPIDGDRVFMTLMSPTLGDGPTWEKHHRYIDIQIALSEGESIAWAPDGDIGGFSPYDAAAGDIQLSHDPQPGLLCPLKAGWFAIYFPWDAHRPGIGQGRTRKAVVKVAAA